MGNQIQYSIVRSNRRSVSIQISREGKVVVKAPYLVPKVVIDRFVTQKNAWIRKQSDIVMRQSSVRKNSYREGDRYLYLGRYYKLHYGRFSNIHIGETLNFPVHLKFRVKKELTLWYIATSKELITSRVQYFAREMGVQYAKIRFSDTGSKWGSCSRGNDLQFNWRLVMAPLNVVDYVVVHELAHTREKNHQQGFWRIVRNYKPAYKQYIKWLRENSYRLHSVI